MWFRKRTKLSARFVTVSFSINRKHISGELFDDLMMRLSPWFLPTYIFHLGYLKPFDRKKFEKVFKGFIYSDDKEQNMGFIYPYHLSSPFVIEFDIYAENLDKLSSVFDLLLNLDGFYVAYAFNKEDSFIQNNSDPEIYERKDIPLPKNMLIRNRHGNIEVDVKRNPGRRVLIDKMWMMSAWQMWFGEQSYGIFDKERLLAFTKAKLIEEESNFVHIQLYENHFDADKKKCREIQKSFRDWMGMDEIDKRFNK